jgi:hypothetical protein
MLTTNYFKNKYCLMTILVLVSVLLIETQVSKAQGFSEVIDLNDNPDIRILFPRSFGIAVNQVGYMQGSSLDATGGPWRAGIRRDFDVRDYQPIAEVGRKVGVRFMSLFALAEMDRLNVVASLPFATQAGNNFDNHSNISNNQIEIMDYVKQNASHIEFGVTGVGHEWWENGIKTRSEWYDLTNKKPRPDSLMQMHIRVIKNILWQYGISEDYGHSFPESFSALGYHWNPKGPHSTGKLFSDNGVKYVTTKFYIIPELKPPPQYSGGFDHGVLVLDREGYGNLWHTYGDLPSSNIDDYEVDLIESHWANWLAEDDFLQEEVNEKWIQYFKSIQAHPYRYLAKNTEQLYSQWLYHEYTEVTKTSDRSLKISNVGMPQVVYDTNMLGNMVLSVPLGLNEYLSSVLINGKPVPSILEEAGYGFIYLPRLGMENYTVSWDVGSEKIQGVIHNKGTYNVYSTDAIQDGWKFIIKMYGTQDVHIRVDEGYKASTNYSGFTIKSQRYDSTAKELIVTISGHNIQGDTGEIIVRKY